MAPASKPSCHAVTNLGSQPVAADAHPVACKAAKKACDSNGEFAPSASQSAGGIASTGTSSRVAIEGATAEAAIEGRERGHRQWIDSPVRAPRVQGAAAADPRPKARATIFAMQLAIAQSNQVLGDLDGNARAIAAALAEAERGGARLLVTPELSLCGYPPEDLLLRPAFIDACARGTRRAGGRR